MRMNGEDKIAYVAIMQKMKVEEEATKVDKDKTSKDSQKKEDKPKKLPRKKVN